MPGIEGVIHELVSQAFNDTGTSLIITIGGCKFAVVAGLFSQLFTRQPGRWRGILVASMLLPFTRCWREPA